MAREKENQRTDARRRARAALSSTEAEAAEAEAAVAIGATPAPKGPGASRRAAASPAQPVRVGIREAFRLAAGTADIVADLRALGTIARTTRAVWIPALLIVIGAVALVAIDGDSWVVALLASVSISPQPTMIPAFLAGMLTRRASWLVGGIAGFLSAVAAVVVYLVGPTGKPLAPLDVLGVIGMGAVFGIAVGAFAGFYRRFLAFSSPARERPARRKRGDRPDGRTRRS